MIPIETLLVFFAAALALAAVPGPDNIFVLTQSALHGRVSGLLVTLGLSTGLLVHTTAAAFGVAVIFQTSQVAFAALKYAGACYLLYLAWTAFRARPGRLVGQKMSQTPAGKLILRGLIMNIANPKVTIFILAFLPQFIDLENGSIIAQFYQFGGLLAVATILVFGAIALTAGTLGDWFSGSARAQIILNRLSGLVLVALALKLATVER